MDGSALFRALLRSRRGDPWKQALGMPPTAHLPMVSSVQTVVAPIMPVVVAHGEHGDAQDVGLH